jgi:hypothetical protein
MTRIGTGLGSRTRTYLARATTTFFQLESARTDDSTVPTPTSVVVLSATNHVRTLDSAYAQGLTIHNPSTTVSLYVGGIEYDGLACALGVSPAIDTADTATIIPPGGRLKFDVRDGTGLCVGVLAGTLDFRVVGN